MLEKKQLEFLAEQVREARRENRQIEPFSSRITGFELDSAYAVLEILRQSSLADNDIIAGRKLGFTNPGMWAAYGVREPFWSYLFAGTVYYCDGNDATCSLTPFCQPKIEPEIVFHLAEAPAAGCAVEELLEAVDWVAHGFEIVQSHYPDWKFAAADTVIDFGLHGALLIGEPQPIRQIADDPISALRTFGLQLSCNTTECAAGIGENVLGSPLLALKHLVDTLARLPEGRQLAAGEIVTTGTVTQAMTVEAGQMWQTHLRGISLPGMTVRFTT